MDMRVRAVVKYALLGIVVVGFVGAAAVYGPRVMQSVKAASAKANAEEAGSTDSATAVGKDTIRLPSETVTNLGIQTQAVERSTAPMMLDLAGTLVLDADRLSHVHARFPGEIVELGLGDGHSPTVCFGQRVHKGQLLAVIWSQDLGEKKSELIDAFSQLSMVEEDLVRISRGAAEGAVPERVLCDAQRKVEAARIAVSRAVRTLQSWRISKEEIDRLRAEADRLAHEKTPDREEMAAQWAKLEVRAPLDGTVIERNVALGDLVDTTSDLFKIADLSRLRVMAHAYEEHLPSLDALKEGQRHWSVVVGSGPDAITRTGQFDQVGCIIDPNQHTALVMGWVDNPDGRLRVGQFVTARLTLSVPANEVVIPSAALYEEGQQQVVFMQPDEKQPEYIRRRVVVTRRDAEHIFLRQQPTAEERQRGLFGVQVGERVVTNKLVQLTATLNTLISTAVKDGAQRPSL